MSIENPDASDYFRIAGRRFENKNTGEIITRRQYDKRFGALAKGGFKSFEEKAKSNFEKNVLEAVSRPARGRTSLRKLSELEKREVSLKRIAEKEQKHKNSPKIKITDLQQGKKSFEVECDWSLEEINKILDQLQSFPHNSVFAYLIGAKAVSEEGTIKYVAAFPYTHYQEKFTQADFEEATDRVTRIDSAGSGRGLIPLSAWIRISFEESFAQKNQITIREKKRPKNLKKGKK